MLTVAESARVMDRWATTGEALDGGYFWCPDGLIVREPGIDNIVRVISGLLDNGEFCQILQRHEDE